MIIIYSIKDNIGGYSFKQVLLLWGLAAMGYGVSRFFFKNAFDLSDIINTGKLDNYLVQPKNVLLSVITSDVEVSALGDILYGYIILFLYGFSIRNFLLYTFFPIYQAYLLYHYYNNHYQIIKEKLKLHIHTFFLVYLYQVLLRNLHSYV